VGRTKKDREAEPSLFDTDDDRARKMAMREPPKMFAAPPGAAGGEPLIPARDYQTEIVDACFGRLIGDGHRSVLAVAATGLGKTVVAGYAVRKWRGLAPALGAVGRVLFLAHRVELLTQARGAFLAVNPGLKVDLEQGREFARSGADVVCGSVATMCGEHRLDRFPRDHFGLVFVDEAHHWVRKNATYQVIMDRFPGAKVIGLTATPDRSDERALGQSFDASLEKVYDLPWGYENGWLVRVCVQMATVDGLDFRGIDRAAGDFKDGDGSPLSELMNQEGPLQGVAAATVEVATARTSWHRSGTRPTLVFASGVDHACRLAEILNRRHAADGTGRAAVVYSQAKGMPAMLPAERTGILNQFRNGYVSYLCNFGVLTEGTDLPDTAVVVLARPSKSRALVAQMVGRGARPKTALVPELNAEPDPLARRALIAMSEKPSVMVLDPIGVCGEHKLCSAIDVLAGWYDDDDVLASAKAAIRKKGGRADVNEELRQARLRKMAEEAHRRRNLIADAKVTLRAVDPFDMFDVAVGREPGWFKGKPATEGQKAALVRLGIPDAEAGKLSFFRASKLLDELITRRKDGKCTAAQAAVLVKYGHEVKELTFAEASALLDGLKAGGWKKPS